MRPPGLRCKLQHGRHAAAHRKQHGTLDHRRGALGFVQVFMGMYVKTGLPTPQKWWLPLPSCKGARKNGNYRVSCHVEGTKSSRNSEGSWGFPYSPVSCSSTVRGSLPRPKSTNLGQYVFQHDPHPGMLARFVVVQGAWACHCHHVESWV